MSDTRDPREGRGNETDLQVWASCIAHDFGNLITLMSCHAELLVRSLKQGSQEQRDAIAVRSAARRAKHLLARWVDFYKKTPLRSEPVDLVRFFDEIVALARPALGAGIQITAKVETKALAVLADRAHLERCLLNLLLNAKDAMQGVGTICVRARAAHSADGAAGELVSIEVTDSGPGVPLELRERIFEPSFTTKAHGSGLGLAMVKAYVTENRGHVAVSNADDSGGACFVLHLPRARLGEGRMESQAPRSAERTTLLLVEPDLRLGPALQRLLEGSGYDVRLVSSAGEALLMAERSGERVECVVMDGPLPWMSCEELGVRLKQLWPDLQTIALAWSEFESRGGVDRIVIKPCHGSVLLRELAELRAARPKQASYTRIKVARPIAVAGNDGS